MMAARERDPLLDEPKRPPADDPRRERWLQEYFQLPRTRRQMTFGEFCERKAQEEEAGGEA